MMRLQGQNGGLPFAVLLLSMQPGKAWGHAFGERYDLPVPLGYFVVGAAAVVALSFVVAAWYMRTETRAADTPPLILPCGPILRGARIACQLLSVALLAMLLIAGFFGTRNPEMNLAPVLVWIVWWVGLSLVVAGIGNIWPALDPWRALFEWVDAAVRGSGFARGISFGLAYPSWVGAWPAVFLLLLFVWIEVIYPQAVVPSRLATLILGWSALTLLGMVCFGPDVWRRNADVFAVYFDMLGRFAPLGTTDRRGISVRLPGQALIESASESFPMVAFVIAMLATVLFDGLLGTQLMSLAHRELTGWLPQLADDRGYFLGTMGLLTVWLLFLGVFLVACAVTARLVRQRTIEIARQFAPTLVPIAIAYNVAHYTTYLLVHGQLIVPLISDPLGRGWNLFDTVRFYPDIGIISAETTWHLAIISIVAGHVVSIWLAHRLALRKFHTPRRAVIASIPLTALMVIYTAISLLVLAEPLVTFGEPTAL
jgi:hypothetical protein